MGNQRGIDWAGIILISSLRFQDEVRYKLLSLGVIILASLSFNL
jgi:hypothetical protein